MCKYWPIFKGQLTRAMWMTRPAITFCNFDVSEPDSRARLAGCNELINTYNLYISDCLYRWPKVMSKSWPPHYKSRGRGSVDSFSQILVVIAKSTMSGIMHGHPWQPSGKFYYVTAVRPCDVIKGRQKFFFFATSFLSKTCIKEAQPRPWYHCVQLIKTRRIIYTLTLSSHWCHVTSGQLSLTLWDNQCRINIAYIKA